MGGQNIGGFTPHQQAALVNEAIGMACDQLLEELCCKVLMEPDDAQDDTPYSPPTAAERATFDALVATSIQAREADGTTAEQPNQEVVWESAISAADLPETEALGEDHTTDHDEATPELTQVVGVLGGVAAPAAGVDSTTSLVALGGGVPVEPPSPPILQRCWWWGGGSTRLRWWLPPLFFTRLKVCMLLF
jgi:hypothetical protein